MPSNSYRRSRAGTHQGGAAAVELAIVIVVLLLLVAGIFSFGRVFWYSDALTKSVRDGARLLSSWPKGSISSQGVGKARENTIFSANAANISPPLASGQVLVQCLDASFVEVTCSDGTAPANVRVSITGFNFDLGAWFPFIGTNGAVSYGSVELEPQTTMRYLE